MMYGDSSKKVKKQRSWCCAACVGQYNWKDPNRVLILHDRADSIEAKVFGLTRHLSVRESHVCHQIAGPLATRAGTTWWTRRRFAGAEQVENLDCAKEADPGGQPRGGEEWRLEELGEAMKLA